MKCRRCGNEDDSLFYFGHRGYYCRKCISFGRVCLNESDNEVIEYEINDDSEEYCLKYPLTLRQKEISDKLVNTIDENDVLLKCVCGAGKTEMVVGVISKYLREKKKVGFAIARRQVVIDVGERLKEYFNKAKVVYVCQGYTRDVIGDLIVCTTHQLYRYTDYFDLLILDEPDAFPFRGNDVLHGIVKNCCKGHIVYLTATPDNWLKKKIINRELLVYELHKRPHGKDMPVPRVVLLPKVLGFIYVFYWLYKHDSHPCILFCPTIKLANLFKKLIKHSFICTSKELEKDIQINNFIEKGGVMVATTVLERGVTFKDVDVCVYGCDNEVFDEASLVQMAGRAGRNFENPIGDVVFIASRKKKMVDECVRGISKCNEEV